MDNEKIKNLKIALVHDFLTEFGGAERVLEVLCEMFPEAPIYTLIYDKEGLRGKFADREIHTSFLQKFPRFLRKRKRLLLPFLPTAPETLDLREFDLIISDSGAWSKGIVTKLDTIHIAYLHSPMRFAWEHNRMLNFKVSFLNSIVKFFTVPFLSYLRVWDRQAADRPDYLIANSKYTALRIKKYYRKDSEVIYPPVAINVQDVLDVESVQSDMNRTSRTNDSDSTFRTSDNDRTPGSNDNDRTSRTSDRDRTLERKFFLVVSRLSAYKRIDLVIEVFNRSGLPLLVIGEGKERRKLQKMAKRNIKFAGWVSDDKMKKVYARTRAFVFPTLDDFGLAPVEAMAHGVPVIAFKKGGALETVREGKNGEFFESQTIDSLNSAVERFIEKEKKYDRGEIVGSVEKFGKERFVREMMGFVKKVMAE